MIKKLLALVTGIILMATYAYGYADLTETKKNLRQSYAEL